MSETSRHPMQPIFLDEGGQARFKMNRIVRHLLDEAKKHGIGGLNKLADEGDFSRDDWTQFMQLLGYTTSGFGELNSLVDPDAIVEADRIADELTSAAPG
jgi:hypothetical protein